jgi:hypothetical protein
MSAGLDDTRIDRALADEPPLEPSPQFAARVMRSVHDDLDTREAIGVPWGRLGLGFSLAAVAMALGAVVPAGPTPAWAAAPELAEAVQWATITLAGTVAIAVGSYRLAGRP